MSPQLDSHNANHLATYTMLRNEHASTTPVGPPTHTGLAGIRPLTQTQPERSQPTPGNRPENQGDQPTINNPKKNRLRANIIIASVNMNGAAAPSENMNYVAKWGRISKMMNEEKIAILAIQETHLDQTMTEQIQSVFEKNLKIIVLAHLESPRAKAGVAFVINKQLIEPEKIETYELIPGKALMLKIRWLKTCNTSILNIYAPNERNAHPDFWATILTGRHTRHAPIPDFTLGDFNMTEDPVDRMPPKLDSETAIEALRDVKQEWDVRDTWHWANPTEKAFTYRARTHNDHIQARLDRIYISKRTEPYTFDWGIKETAIPTDHLMVTVKYAPKDAPYIG